MQMDELELFLTLARTRHFQQASVQSNISPSALSRAIQRIENEVGEKLFDRNNRNVSLTPAGLVFRSYAEQMLKIWKEGRQALSQEKGVISGELGIYCSVTAAYGVLPEILDGFRKAYPHVHIKLRTGDAESALEQLQKGDTDIAIAAIPEQMPEPMESILVARTPLVWISSCNSEIRSGQDIDWKTTPLILPKQGIARMRFDRWRKEMRIQPSIYAQVTGNEAIIAMVHLGCGIGLVPEMVLEKSPVTHTIDILEVVPPLKPYGIGICVNRKSLGNGVTKAFWDTARTYSLPHGGE
ncbi:HTH-type transcriptional activator IlvY [Desulfobotulus sp.]|jgi:LysR family positive regulator for ilvC|uniref:HTH-type transcriptional activator IlvY n=1 Tax=Desulfobotulus sp. TaxID=1940337 RepID=UPI002A36DBCA|nr:HTH-type transcriptional activator IlvY [Desulfobotulus sp.]MDY0162497.1 HTH-type transcriptional activator IlvY [Desulfobotulus sp.]